MSSIVRPRTYYAALDPDCDKIEAVYSSQQQAHPADGIPEDLRDVASRLGRRFVALDVSDAEAADLVLDLDRGITRRAPRHAPGVGCKPG